MANTLRNGLIFGIHDRDKIMNTHGIELHRLFITGFSGHLV